jgi:hypothetical protein
MKGSRTSKKDGTAAWFFEDRAIERVDDDRLDHQAVAAILVKAVEAAHPPCMIGLLAEFGKGKSSTANIAATTLRDAGTFDTATVSADKHSGNARARNIVHAIAGELETYNEIDPAAVREILRPLRQSTQVAAPDPTDTPANRFAEGRYSYKGLVKSLLPFAIVAAVAAAAALLAGAPLENLLTIAAASPILVWVVAMTFAGSDTPMGSIFTPSTLTDQKPRAEAADEIEEVFGQLIDYHYEERRRRLVVFVDDIDRLSKDDLLDALRALRSLQSVPRGREPIFVISGNEKIVRSAISTSSDAPAQAASEPPSAGENREESGDADEAAGEDDDAATTATTTVTPDLITAPDSDHDHPALAFIDKLLTVRVPMPPTMRGDMRRFAAELVAADHPLRLETDIDVDRVLAILVHDGVDDPRSVIRLLNRFIAGYLLGREREQSGRVFRGDVTHYPDVLAQLAVILDEFAAFYEDITRNPVTLEAGSKVALRQANLTPSERDALARSNAFLEDAASPGGFRFRRETLRRYLSGTARLVNYPADIGPLVYFTATPGGRSLGVELRGQLMSSLRVGDAEELATVLERVPSDRITAAGEEIADVVRHATPIDAPNYLAAVAPNLSSLDTTSAEVADACADLLDHAALHLPPAETLIQILDHVDPGRDALVCHRLIRHDDDPASTNARLVHAATYLATHPRVRDHVERALLEWVSVLPSEGGWDLARPWLDVTQLLDTDDHEALLHAIATALTGMVRSESGFTAEDGDHLVTLVGRVRSPDLAPRATQLSQRGPNTQSTFVRLWSLTGHQGDALDTTLAVDTAREPGVETAVRQTAVGLVADWAEAWKDATRRGPEDEEQEDLPVAPELLEGLANAASDPTMANAVGGALPALAQALGERIAPLLDAVTAEAEARRDDGNTDDADAIAFDVVDALRTLPEAMVTSTVARLLTPIGGDLDPTAAAVEHAYRLIPRIVELEHGRAALASVADTWSTAIRRAGEHDDRSRLEGFRVVARALPDVIAERAATIYSQVEQLLQGNDDPVGRLRVMAQFPWPDEQVTAVLTQLDARWDAVPDDSRLSALALVDQAPDSFELLGRYLDRVVNAVDREPVGPASSLAAGQVQRMSDDQRRRLFVAGAGVHTSVTEVWAEAGDDDVAATVAQHADGVGARRLLDSLSEARRPSAARKALAEIAATDNIPEDLVGSVADACDSSGLREAADAALGELPAPNPRAASALRVLLAAASRGVSADSERVDRLIPEMLPAASDEVARLLGAATRGRRRLLTEAHECLKQLREDEDGRHLAAAFDAARSE